MGSKDSLKWRGKCVGLQKMIRVLEPVKLIDKNDRVLRQLKLVGICDGGPKTPQIGLRKMIWVVLEPVKLIDKK